METMHALYKRYAVNIRYHNQNQKLFIHVQFIMEVIHLLNTEVKGDFKFVKAWQKPLSQEPPSSL